MEIAPLTPTSLAKAVGISVPYASQLLSNRADREPSRALAIRIFRKTSAKLGPIKDASAAEIRVLEKFEADTRPASTRRAAA